MRTLVCLGVALLLVTAVRADDKKDGKAVHGKVVRVNADSNTITIRCEDKEKEFKVSDTTKIFGSDKKPLSGGLKGADQQLKEGTEVWFHTGTGADEMMITELRLSKPDGLDREKDK